MCEDWCHSCDHKPSLPRERTGQALIPSFPASSLIESQLSVLNLVGVSTLVVVPRIRTSAYLEMLASVAPALAGTRSGDELNIAELPTLRRILLVNDGSLNSPESPIGAVVDFREVFQWECQAHEAKVALDRDDVINLQFTRFD
jgi:hypothetical protein